MLKVIGQHSVELEDRVVIKGLARQYVAEKELCAGGYIASAVLADDLAEQVRAFVGITSEKNRRGFPEFRFGLHRRFRGRLRNTSKFLRRAPERPRREKDIGLGQQCVITETGVTIS